MRIGKLTGVIGGIEGTDANGNVINKIGLWTKSGFVEVPTSKLFPQTKPKKNDNRSNSVQGR